jgi:site-specific recombinase
VSSLDLKQIGEPNIIFIQWETKKKNKFRALEFVYSKWVVVVIGFLLLNLMVGWMDGWMDLHAIKQPKTHFRVLYLPPNYMDYRKKERISY